MVEGLDWWEQERLGFGPYDEHGYTEEAYGAPKGLGKGKGGVGMAALLGQDDGAGDWYEVDEEGRRVGEPRFDPKKMKDFYVCE